MADRALPQIDTNPLQVVQDPRVVSGAMGVLGANLLRKALFTQQRSVFGYAAKGSDGRIRYYENADEAKKGDAGKQIASAYQNRIFLHLGYVLFGTLAMTYGKEARKDDVLSSTDDTTLMVKYAGLGFAASGFANLVMTLFNIE